MTYYVYMVECANGTFYTGISTDVERRVRQHNGELAGGAKYTQGRRPVTLVYVEKCPTRALALQREYYLKRLQRTAKEELVRLSHVCLE